MPIIVAGDLLHSFNQPPELINHLIDVMPAVYAVAGNHDLSNHSLNDINRSAFMTLIQAGKVTRLFAKPSNKVHPDVLTTGFACGQEPCVGPIDSDRLNLAVVHAYCYEGHTYPGVNPHYHWSNWIERLKGYDVVHFGDNHTAIHVARKDTTLFGAGAFIRRRGDERHLKPHVGILMSNGTVEKRYLDTSKDKWVEGLDEVAAGTAGVDCNDFLEALLDMGNAGIDFNEAVREYMRLHKSECTPEVRRLILRILESNSE